MDRGQNTFRLANREDMPFLLDLRQQTMNPHLLASGVTPSVAEHERRILFRFDCAEIIELGGGAIGLLKIVRDGKDRCLIQIQLKPGLQGQGLGTQLIQSLIDEARKAEASLSLQVLKANPARRLYERLGFAVLTETTHAYPMRLERHVL